MMIDFFEKQFIKWNDEQKCGECWSFSAPLVESAVNVQQLEQGKECCVSVMLTRDRGTAFSVENRYDSRSGYASDSWITKNFTLIIGKPDRMDLNNHIELRGNSTDNAKYRLLEKLEECIISMEFEFCEFLDVNWQVTNWSATQLLNYQDESYTGWRLSIQIKKRKEDNF